MAVLQPQPAVGQASPTPTGHWWRFALRVGAVAALTLAMKLWPPTNSGYGVAFWLWVCAVVAYALSFERALRTSASPRRMVKVTLVGILILAAALRLVLIKRFPAEIHIDEVLPGIEALHIVQGRAPNVFSSVGWFTTPNLAFAFPALAMEIASNDLLRAARLTSAVMGVAGILALYLLARRLFEDRAALIASFLTAVSFWHMHDSRTAFSYIQSSFCAALVMYLVVRARQDRSRATLALAGVALGLALECYFPVRILLLVCPLFWLPVVARQPARTTLADAATFVTGTLLVLTPLLFNVRWSVLVGHSQQVLITNPAVLEELERRYGVVGLPAVFLRNLRETAAMFTEWANPCVWHQTPAGLLDAGTFGALVIGVIAALVDRKADALLLLAWAALTFIFGVAFTSAPRAAYRMATAMPALFILAGYGVERVLGLVDWAARRYGRAVRPVVLAGFALWVLAVNCDRFFVRYANRAGRENSDSKARRLLAAHCDGREFFFVGGWLNPTGGVSHEPGALDLFCPQHKPVTAEQIRAGIQTTHAATFLVLEADNPAIDILRRCYPSAQIVPRRSRDGRFLFVGVDIGAGDLDDGHRCDGE
jgi:hypothetical protein